MTKGDDWDAGSVLDRGLTHVPTVLGPNDEVPVATLQIGRVGAVLSISYDPADDEEPFLQEVEVLVRNDESSWTWHSTSGSDWPVPYGQRPSTGDAALTGFATGAPGPQGGNPVWIASGVAAAGVERVLVTERGSEDVVEVEPVTGAFLVALQDLGDVRVVTAMRSEK